MTAGGRAPMVGNNFDPRHWSTTDGHRYTSVPAPAPQHWQPRHDDRGLVYASGRYTIRRRSYGLTGWTYTVHRDGIELSLAFYSRLCDAKQRAVTNAAGRDVVNVA